MANDIRGSAALVTGASRGIGRAVAVALASAGCDIALLARSAGDLEETARLCRETGVRAVPVEADLADRAALAAAIERGVGELGRLNLLVNNAGVSAPGRANEADLEHWDLALDVNLRAAMHATRLALPHIEREERGAVIFIASIAGKMTMGGGGAYCATKHGVVGFSGSVFEDVREKNIKVCAICPGFVNTDMVGGPGLDASRMIQPEDVAEAVLFVAQFPDTGCPTEIILRPQRTPYR